MNETNAIDLSGDDVSRDAKEIHVRNAALPPDSGVRFKKKPLRKEIVRSWWFALSRSAPEGIGVAGLKYILLSRERRSRRLWWLLILSIAMVGCTFQIIERIMHFSTFPLSVDSSINETESELVFPKVVICNSNFFVKSKTQAYPAIDKILRNYENQAYNLGEIIPLTPEDVEQLLSFNTTEIFNELKHQKEDMFIRAVFAGVPISLDDIQPVFTSFGRCYQINDGQKDKRLLRARAGGRAFGLSLMLNVEQEKYYYNVFLKDAVGFDIHLLDQEEGTYPYDVGFQVGPGASTAVSITKSLRYNAKPPYGVCGEKKLQYYDKYSRIKCFSECMTNAVVSTCGCRAPALPGKAPVCDLITTNNCANAFFFNVCDAKKEGSCRNAFSDPNSQNGTINMKNCNCPLNCEETKFSVSLSTAKYPSNFRTNLLAKYHREGLLDYHLRQFKNTTLIEHDIAAVDLFFEDISTVIVTQQAAYSIFALLSDIGGALGLWLGGSLLTIFEILDLCGHSFVSKI
nr:acid-sensing ion channel 1B-like [Lytechinus pictus]